MEKPPSGEIAPKPVRWIGSARDDLSAFPADVKGRVGLALWKAQIGSKAPYAKPLRGFGGGSVLEVVDDFDGNTYRAATPYSSRVPYTSSMPSRRSRGRALRPRWGI